jgi:hypothetical protein
MPGWLDNGTSNSTPRVPQAPASPRISPPPSVKPVKPVDPARVRPNGLAIGAGAATPKAWDPVASANRAVSSVTKTLGRMSAPPLQPAPAVDPAATPAAAAGRDTAVAPQADPTAFPTGQEAYDRWVKNPVSAVGETAVSAELAAGGGWLAGQGLRAVGSKAAPALISGSNYMSGLAAPLSRLATNIMPAVTVGDAGVKLWNNRNDVAGSTARMAQSNANNSTLGGYLGNVPAAALQNFGQLASGDGTPLFELADAGLGGVNDAGRGLQQALRGSTLDSALQSRQAVNDQTTSRAMQTGTATQQQLRDAAVYAQRQREADMQARNWQPWLWGMSQ